MTAQFSDSIAIDGKCFALLAEPLGELVVQRNIRFAPQSTACWRGYVADWEVSEGRLFLVNVSGVMSLPTSDVPALYCARCGAAVQANCESCPLCGTDQFSSEAPANRYRGPYRCKGPYQHDGPHVLQTVGLADLFPESDGRVFADWVTGVLRVPQGKMIEYVHMGYDSCYESYLLLQVDHGMVIAVTTETTETGGRQRRRKGGRIALRRALAALLVIALILPSLIVWLVAANQVLAERFGAQLYPLFPVVVIGMQVLMVTAMLWGSCRLVSRVVGAGLIALCVGACNGVTLNLMGADVGWTTGVSMAVAISGYFLGWVWLRQ